ncbi:MAG: EAL domain-containing protein, partial [Pseudomonadota bacterium]
MSDASFNKYIEAAASSDLLDLFREIFTRELVYPVFQPIVDVRNQCVFGYEALIRGPQGSRLVSPYDLFRCASQLSLGDEFEVLCRKVSIRQFAQSSLPHRLFLNTSPAL